MCHAVPHCAVLYCTCLQELQPSSLNPEPHPSTFPGTALGFGCTDVNFTYLVDFDLRSLPNAGDDLPVLLRSKVAYTTMHAEVEPINLWMQVSVCLESGLECAWSQAWNVCLESGLECVPGVRPGVCVWSQAWSGIIVALLGSFLRHCHHHGFHHQDWQPHTLSSSWLSHQDQLPYSVMSSVPSSPGPATLSPGPPSSAPAAHAIIRMGSTCNHQGEQHMLSSG